MTDADFKNWLIRDKKFTPKTARDVLSRYKRVAGFLNKEHMRIEDVDEILYRLSKKNAFLDLSISVKSQLRRALKLRYEFLSR